MATIGTFKKSGSEFTGEIVTLRILAKNVRIVPEPNRSADSAPSHRVILDAPKSALPGHGALARAASISASSSMT